MSSLARSWMDVLCGPQNMSHLAVTVPFPATCAAQGWLAIMAPLRLCREQEGNLCQRWVGERRFARERGWLSLAYQTNHVPMGRTMAVGILNGTMVGGRRQTLPNIRP